MTIPNLTALKDDPVQFVREFFGVEPIKYQADYMHGLVTKRQAAWRSAHGNGKTTTLAWILFWFLLTRKFSEIIHTAPTGRQVKKTLWKEVAKWYRRAKLRNPAIEKILDLLLTGELRVRGAENEWRAFGFSASRGSDVEGMHNENILLIMDEVKGIDQDIIDSLQGALTNKNAMQAWTSTPGAATGSFYKVFTDTTAYPDWYRQVTTAYDAPEWLISRKWIEDRKRVWGEDSPLFKARVLAQFVADASDQLIQFEWLERSIKRYNEQANMLISDKAVFAAAQNALDVARSNSGNENVYMSVRGNRLHRLEAWHKDDLMFTTGKTASFLREDGSKDLKVDIDGLGAGVGDRLKEMGFNVIGFHGGMRPKAPEIYNNARSEMYYELAERFKAGTLDISNDDLLVNQLLQIRKDFNSKEILLIESKDKMRKRGLKSPDRADALAMSVYKPADEMIQPEESDTALEVIEDFNVNLR